MQYQKQVSMDNVCRGLLLNKETRKRGKGSDDMPSAKTRGKHDCASVTAVNEVNEPELQTSSPLVLLETVVFFRFTPCLQESYHNLLPVQYNAYVSTFP